MLHVIVLNNDKCIRTAYLHISKMIDEYLLIQKNFHSIGYEEIVNKSEANIRDFFTKLFGKLPDNLIFIEHLTDINDLHIPKEIKINIIIDDLHHQGSIKEKELKILPKFHDYFRLMDIVFPNSII